MENRMDRQDQVSEDNQPPSPASKQSSLSALSRTQWITSPEQRLFRRIMWLTLLLGIMVGITLIIFGASLYVLTGHVPHAFYPTSPIIYRLPTPLMLISFGLTYILIVILQRLRRQHPIFYPGRFDLFFGSPTTASGPGLGLFFIWCGAFEVLTLWLSTDTFWGNLILVLWIIGSIIGLLAIFLIPFLKRFLASRKG